MDAINSAYFGMASASNQLDTTAAAMARGTTLDPSTVVSAVQAKNDFQANAAVMKTADRMTGTLLDMKV
jgi:flagellar hook protein FlgE